MAQRGFTLIEMAIVLTVVGLLVGGGLLAVGPVIDKAKFNQTNNAMDQVENALVLFVIRNERLPCPADGALAPSTAFYGLEQPAGGGACSVALANSVIPWRTLGLDENYSTDGWSNRLTYYAAQPGALGVSAAATNITTKPLLARIATTPFPTYPSGPFLTVTDATTSQPVTPPATSNDQAAYVLISHGKSGWYAYSKSGTQHATAFAGGPKLCNSTPNACQFANSFASGTGIGAYPPQANTYFDDILRWRSPAFLIQSCGSGACGN